MPGGQRSPAFRLAIVGAPGEPWRVALQLPRPGLVPMPPLPAMKTVTRALITVVFVLLAITPPAWTAEAPVSAASTIIVLDASSSMRERIHGEAKIDIAKRAVRELVGSLPAHARLGLVVYGHRKANDCTDIELLIRPGKLDRAAFVAAVDSVKPTGLTPLSAALEFAADSLEYRKLPANVILVSDGVETCGRNPCATAAKLKAAGIEFVVHAVAFDISARDAKSLSCIAATTGGRFLQANDAASLKDALYVAIAEAAVASPAKPPAPPPEIVTPVTIKATPSVLAGAAFPVGWTGPDNTGDYITIVAKGTPDDDDGNLAYTRQGSPVQLTAPIDPGEAELRYVAGRSHKVLGRAGIKITSIEVTLTAAAEATAGSNVSVAWKGPGNDGDYITIVPKAAGDGEYAQYSPTREGSPLVVLAPIDPGDAEIRYVSGTGHRVLARRLLLLRAAEITLTARDEVVAGASVEIAWKGPNNTNDYLTIVEKSKPDGGRSSIAYTAGGSRLTVTAPSEAGACEIRYMSGQGDRVLARRTLTTVVGEVTLSAANETVEGASVTIAWTGPNNENDYLTIVERSQPEGSRGSIAYTAGGSPLEVTAPGDACECEIRYVRGNDDKVLGRRPLKITTAQVALRAPAHAPLGAQVSVEWTGPNNQNDFITIAPTGSPDDTSPHFTWTLGGSPLQVDPPEAAGPCEIRYVSGQNNRVLARVPIEITAADAQR